LFSVTTGSFNTAVGVASLDLNNGNNNTALGVGALLLNSTGTSSTAVGLLALENNATGSSNTAVGNLALSAVTAGDFNTALGVNAGSDPDILSNNLYLGDAGFAGDENTIAIGGVSASGTDYTAAFIGGIYGATVNTGDALPVFIGSDGHLGTAVVNATGKQMRMRSLKAAQPQVKVSEFQKQQKRIAELESTVARLAATVKEQAAQIEKVSAQLELRKPAGRVVLNKH
jgi:hypothetical protein